VIFTPRGDVKVDDRDELDVAFQSGTISKEQYDSALRECDLVVEKYCTDIAKTELLCTKIFSHINDMNCFSNVLCTALKLETIIITRLHKFGVMVSEENTC